MATETAILLHSSGSTPRQWSALAGRLSARLGLPAVAPHVEGLASLEAEVERICREVPREGVHLVGHSHGGAVAIRAALSGRLDVRSVTVYEPSLFAMLEDPYASPNIVGHEIIMLMSAGMVEEAARLYVDYWTEPGEFDRMSPDKRTRLVQRMPSVTNCFTALFTDGARAADLACLAMPVLVMSGRRSPRPSQDICELVAGSVPHGRLHHFASLSHMGPVTAPESVNAVIADFLDEVADARKPQPARRAA